MSNNASGVMRVQVDDLAPYEVSLWSRNVSCGVFVDQFLGNGSHSMKLSLIGPATSGSEGLSYTPVMHLMSIWCVWDFPLIGRSADSRDRRYAIPQPSNGSVPSSESTEASPSSRGVAGIIAGTVCGVVGLLAILFAIFFLVRRRRTPVRKSTYTHVRYDFQLMGPEIIDRHTFNPNTVIITELSPRSPTDDKLPPYARMDDDHEHDLDVKSQHLAVPIPALGYKNAAGLRSRSPSPAPPERRV